MIRCTQQENIECLKCGKIKRFIVRVGAFYMCNRCFIEEFGTEDSLTGLTDINPQSPRGTIYSKWLKKYKES